MKKLSILKPLVKKIFLICCVSFIPLSYAKNDLAQSIDKKIKAKALKKSSLGLIVSKIQKGNTLLPLYKLNENNLFTPASLVKIATLSALYNSYPNSYTFKTSLISSAPLKDGILEGDLILKGGGDSSFTSESLWNLINAFTRSNIKEIKGNLLIDDTLYNKEPALPYSERSYLAPASASSFNWNSVTFYIHPAKTLKDPALVFVDPENSYIKIINNVKTGTKNKITIKRRSAGLTKEIFEIKGTINIHKKEIVKYRNIVHPALWLGHNTLAFLKQRGIKISGQVKKGTCSGVCKNLAEWESKPFVFHTYNLMKFSNNLVARMLVSHLPLLEGDKKGDLRQGMKKINSYLREKEQIKKFHFVEPSGLNRKNRFTPKDLQKILINSRKHNYQAEMLFTYPLSGGKGTLKKRFKKLPPSSFVRAKTGSLYGVLGLAGFTGSTKEKYVFVFIFNGKASKSLQAQSLFDEIILLLN